MRFWILMLLLGFAGPAFADDFGSRFDDQSPAALSSSPSAEALGAMEPAAGDEDTAAPENAKDQNQVKEAAPQAQEPSKTEAVSVKGRDVVYE